MANNCLVTKLKASVNNPDLVKINEFKVKSNAANTGIRVAFINTGNSVTTIHNGVETTVDGTVYSVGDSDSITRAPMFTLAEGDFLSAINKYDISALQITQNIKKLGDFNLNYFPNLVALNTSDKFDVNSINTVNNKMRYIDSPELYGDMSNLVMVYPMLKQIYTRNTAHLTCSLDDIAELSNLSSITLAGASFGEDNSIESLVAKYRTNGRTTGSFTKINLILTFQGTSIPNNTTLSWTATTITCNGVTIEA